MNITILGSGFAALTAVEQVKKLAPTTDICVIAPTNRFIYYPSLIWIPSGGRKGDDITCDLTRFFQKHGVTFIQANVTAIETQGRCVKTDSGDYCNDGLIIATGCQFQKTVPGLNHAHILCQGPESAHAIKKALNALASGTIAIGLNACDDEPSAMRGAAPVFEFAFVIDRFLRQQNRRDDFELVFFSSQPEPAASLGQKASQQLLKQLEKQQIKTIFGEAVKAFESNTVVLEKQSIDDVDLILFQPAMTGADWLSNSELPRSPAGLIQADAHAQVVGWEKTYVAGDAGSYPGPDWQPKLGVNAVIQAKVAAANLTDELNNNQRAKKKISTKLIYVVDMLNAGILLKRNEKGCKAIGPSKLFHFSKRLVEWLHLRKFG